MKTSNEQENKSGRLGLVDGTNLVKWKPVLGGEAPASQSGGWKNQMKVIPPRTPHGLFYRVTTVKSRPDIKTDPGFPVEENRREIIYEIFISKQHKCSWGKLPEGTIKFVKYKNACWGPKIDNFPQNTPSWRVIELLW